MARLTMWRRKDETEAAYPYGLAPLVTDPLLSNVEARLFTHDKAESAALLTDLPLRVGDVLEDAAGRLFQETGYGLKKLPLWDAQRLRWRFGLFLGESAWRHPALPDRMFLQLTKGKPPTADWLERPVWKGKGKQQRLERKSLGDVKDFYWSDTRPTTESVAAKLRAMEALFGDTWDEYLSVSSVAEYAERAGREWEMYEDKWPLNEKVLVSVVTGGNEGLYLHVNVRVRIAERETATWPLIIGKSLGSSWDQCWQSAARIAWVLGA